MKYQFSTIVDPATYDNEGLSNGIDLRKNNFTHFEDRGAIRAQQDWAKHVAPIKQFKGTLGHDYSFMTVCVPECIPIRLEIISYANEFAFMYDDDTELDNENNTSAENDKLIGIFLAGTQGWSSLQDQSSSGKTRILKQLFSEMVEIDKECAIVTMKAWAEFLRVGSSRQHGTVFTRLEDYLPYRIKDVGEMFWFGVVTFGMALHIPDHEMDACHKLMEPAWIAVGLANDVFSWPKERDASQRLGRTHVVNAVWVVMQEHGFSQKQADQYCRELAAQYVSQYVDSIRNIKNEESISPDLRTYVEAMQYSISGNVIWSKFCPRYNPEKRFNQTQLDWMQNELPSSVELDRASNTSSSFLSTSTHGSPVSGSQATIESKEGWTADSSGIVSLLLNCSLPPLSHKVISAPWIYVDSLPSKGTRDMFLDALNHWLRVDGQRASQVKMAIRMLHNASLMLDDVQDGSPLRRSKPSAHRVFGVAQTTNSAAFLVNESIKLIRELAGDQGVAAVLEKLTSLFVGQAQDLHSSRNLSRPSLTEYIQTIDQKTSALFELASRLMCLCSTATVVPNRSLSRFCILLGRFFQIRDDYQNLTSPEYTKQKGFCDDLDSGTYTLPLVYAISQQSENLLLQNLLSTRLAEGTLDDAQKRLALDQMQLVKTDEFLQKILASLYDELRAELQCISSSFASENPQMELMLVMLKL
ncbi:fusicoccadiene synthase [Corynespora cassiicola Philippines]|uniref:geranylgeranyl diphosphate synthase n=1 Tax=Corynespora cassiicola Philippines TaxID=1448308 RepID=A0A2T2N170_CORCC|nr:fusicoccadiene synthase [Corynespora cassiicola Philippines]